jgi:hypothetical protein
MDEVLLPVLLQQSQTNGNTGTAESWLDRQAGNKRRWK